ncbi:peptidyl-prolyl cis-trans isomerase sig-7 isoform X1 [Drosophila rhopaloa]|uniref:Peptidyl-prolyl cis-trans isomerase n=2 Tax=Drosophila rhopaloa TaxID=1041015 RepID=A0ABM5HL64_DRORH|nr:peptidyl-prolyl cis-trans isomerase sig-7 isoform X1 [Drosophila rhopaloa]
MSVVIETTLGDLTVDLFTKERPIACLNFLKLCRLKYYNYNLFHTVQQGFIAQTGDPSGAGDGGSSIWGVVEGLQKRFFEAEYLPKIPHSSAGMLSLVSAGKNLVGSQFFFTLGENLSSLDGSHCVIGEVVEGHEVLRKLNDAIVDDGFRPYQDIRITHTVVLEDPFPNPRGLQAPSRSPSPSAERLQNGRIAADEDIDDTDGMTMEELQEMLAEREAKARATILEIVGDLPDADMAPPENVLFVCKLNPVTTDDDLEIIFSRFGVVKGCEVIRDRKTGDSLQYAFVEFEDQKSCEAAYFKMDNVLIDDRRIHVDFSQSVSKVTWRGKGRGIVGDEEKLDFDNLRDNNDRRKPNNTSRGRTDDHRDRKRSENPRSRMSSAERRTAREQRHQEQNKRDDRNSFRRRSASREPKDRRRSRSRNPDNRQARDNLDQRRFNDREQGNRNNRRPSRSRDLTQRRRSRSNDRVERRRSGSRERNERRRSRPKGENERRRSRSRDQIDKRQPQSQDSHNRRRHTSPQDRRRNENGGGPYRKTGKNQGRSPERRPQSRDRDEHRLNRNSSRKQSPNGKRKLSVSVEKNKKPSKKSKRPASSSSDSSESSSESESESDTTSSDSSDSSSSSSSSDERSKRKKNKKSKQKSKGSHKSKKKQHRK